MNNDEIRREMRKSNVYLWQVADKLNMHESVLSKWFRYPLTEYQKNQVLSAMQDIKLSRIKEQK
ncbi:MAG: hypothetical protein QM657_14035 [Lacrimispora sp.]|uniref:hypothetical protein n=1 Tax=Lacrimispora sp. TaxID=2719234 RepID=UPI0039E52135